jgi:hypothetical protein
LILAAGCAGGLPPAVIEQPRPQVFDPLPVGPDELKIVVAAPPEFQPELQPDSKPDEQPAVVPAPPVVALPEAAAVSREPAKPAPRPKVAVVPAPVAAPLPPPVSAPAAVAVSPVPAPRIEAQHLDVAALKARLRSTKAIGVVTKLALQNQMNDLLDQFRAHHQSGQTSGVGALREPFDALVRKVVSVLHDGDPSLASEISASREAIWDILADPEKFDAAS